MKTIRETNSPSGGVTVDMEIDVIDGEKLDTRVTLSGEFWVGGSERMNFNRELGELIDKYRI